MKARRADSAARRHGYDRASRAIQLAFEIRALREKKGLSQRQLAELVGTTQSAIARLEGGRISPSLPTLDRIASALDAEVTITITADLAKLSTPAVRTADSRVASTGTGTGDPRRLPIEPSAGPPAAPAQRTICGAAGWSR